ncbi:putative bifunctional diguanylate cyclase/phosphodiesterase [Sphingomonas azotifigens]|uniref:putative bifunctional diguanylate cyclase/phosphodiesterase n=1 Tax=Sphingomonas azotifigens TaxID=330920 RepID=UPI001FE8AB21|nr:EAL domain-containing protein [Sphingomonas azotifigens]
MYTLVFLDAVFLGFASHGSVSPRLSVVAPILLGIAAAVRSLLWVTRRTDTIPSIRKIRRYLIGTILAAAVLSLAFGGWALVLFFEADLARRTSIALYIFIGAVTCCYCLQTFPVAGWLVMMCGASPVVVCLLLSGDRFLVGLGVNIVLVSAVVLRMFGASHAGFIEVLASRAEMAIGQRRARLAEQRAHRLAYHDPLTGLPNRRALAGYLRQAGPGQFGLMLVDLDRFKSINDVHGHPIGDQLLRAVAGRLRWVVGEGGRSYRLGGDEFAISLPYAAGDLDRVRSVAHAIVREVARPFLIDDRMHHIGASVGIALYPEDATDADTLMRRADVALYQAKEAGRGCYCAFAAQMDAEIRRRSTIETEMREALAESRFYPRYQPIVDLRTGQVTGFELLARWRRDDSEIGPDQFIPIAEECGLLNTLMLDLLDRACLETRDWAVPVSIAINISPGQLRDEWLSHKILSVLARTGFPPARLTVEITENALIVDADKAHHAIESLKNQGVQLALDDFGTGYASIQHLRMLPFDKIKIDRSFVESLTDGSEALRIVRAILGLASTLELPVVAEGIETLETAEMLRGLGCAQGQGYLFGRPMDKDEVACWLADGVMPPAAEALIRRSGP